MVKAPQKHARSIAAWRANTVDYRWSRGIGFQGVISAQSDKSFPDLALKLRCAFPLSD